jgi:hypothetical protein
MPARYLILFIDGMKLILNFYFPTGPFEFPTYEPKYDNNMHFLQFNVHLIFIQKNLSH